MNAWEQEIREPTSWIAGILAILIAFLGPSVLSPWSLLEPHKLGIVIGVLLGFIVHEFMHRNVARLYGLSSEFVAHIPGLVITAVSALLPIRILTPGYVRVYGHSSRKGYAFSIAAGPLSNIIIALLGVLVSQSLNYPLRVIAIEVAEVNLWLAFFNLLPIPPLDGYKLASLDLRLWLSLLMLLVFIWLLW
ncbi:MAG: hypothetical protein QXN05_03155 [Acidilobaceae archaeon]